MSKTYTFEYKKKLKDRIEKITEKKILEKIRDIIFKQNPDINVSQNSSGMLLFFHNLTDNTYNKLELFLNKLDNDKLKVITASYTDTQEDIKIKINDKNSNIRLSSIEKNLIKKKDYYDKLQEENNCDSDDIFLDKDSLSSTPITANNKKTKNTNKK